MSFHQSSGSISNILMLSIEKITQVLVTKWQMEEHFVPFLQTNNRRKTVKKMNYVLALIFKRCLCNIIAAPTMPGIKPRHFIRDMKNSICAILILTEKIDFDIHSLSKLGLLLHKMSFVKTAVPMTVIFLFLIIAFFFYSFVGKLSLFNSI